MSEGGKLALSEGEVDTLKEKLDAARQLIANLEEELTNHKEDACIHQEDVYMLSQELEKARQEESREEVSLQYSFVQCLLDHSDFAFSSSFNQTETHPILQSLGIDTQTMTHLDYAQTVLESDQPPFMKIMTEFLLSQEEDGPTFTGTLFPISDKGIIEESSYLRMVPDGRFIRQGGYIAGEYKNGKFLYRSVDPIRHIYVRLETLVQRLISIIRDHGPKHDAEDESWVVSLNETDIEYETGSDDEDEHLSTRAQRIFEITCWSWDTIRAFAALVDDYLVQSGSSMDDFMNRKYQFVFDKCIVVLSANE